MKGTVTLCGGLRFLGVGESGHAVVMDGPPGVGGSDSGPRPSELLLLGLAGCTAMDVISILRKKRQAVTALEVTVRGEPVEGYPSRIEKFTVTYTVRGKDVDPEAVRRSIQLSEEKYCTVGGTLTAGAAIESEFEILP